MKTATVLSNEIPVTHSIRPEVNREYLTIDCPKGWEDVKKLVNKTLEFDGRKFSYTGWNSDLNVCYFVRSLKSPPRTAKIV